ncbi:hypothetical protein BJX64DRAFT_276399 [Aspergillus heterothallicus]
MKVVLDHPLSVSMMIAAFTGISWYVGAEINISLFLVFKRRGRGLYFWSCAFVSWGVVLQPLFIILADFHVWKENQIVPAILLIYLTWMIMVVPQSWVLYSRLHLIMSNATVLQVIKWILVFNSFVFSIPTMVIGTMSQTTNVNPNLPRANLLWGRAELAVFFIQETALSMIYIIKIKTYLRDRSPLHQLTNNNPDNLVEKETSILRQLVWVNVLIIALDIALLAIHGAGLFHLQGAMKPCVYGIKLKVEFVILNRLRDGVRRLASGRIWLGIKAPAN